MPLMPLSDLVYVGSRSANQAYAVDDKVWTTEPGCLVPTIGTVTTPDPGPMPTEFTFVFKVRGPIATGGNASTIASQFGEWGGPDASWELLRFDASRAFGMWHSPDGTTVPTGGYTPPAPAPAGTVEVLAYSVNMVTDLTQGWRFTDDSWQPFGEYGYPAITTLFDSSLPVTIGDGANIVWDDRIYSVELREGLDPNSYVDAHLVPMVGTVTTPDPGPLPAQHVFVFKVQGPADAGNAIVSQWNAQPSYIITRHRGDVYFYITNSADGVNTSPILYAPSTPIGSGPETLAIGFDHTAGTVRSWTSTDGAWSAIGSHTFPSYAWFDSNDPVCIGASFGGLAGQFNGSIYSVELHTGLDPNEPTAVPAIPGYLTPTVGTVTTPDPGPLPNECTFVMKVRGPKVGGGSNAIAGQFELTANRSWVIRRDIAGNGQFIINGSNNGDAIQTRFLASQTPLSEPETLALSFHLSAGALTTWKHDGTTWQQLSTSPGAAIALFDTTLPVRIGASDYMGTWDDRIYSVELRHGLDPVGGGDSWLEPMVGTVTTPDPGPLPNECMFVYKVRGPSNRGGVASQYLGGTDSAYFFIRQQAGTNEFATSSDGTSGTSVNLGSASPASTGNDQWLATSRHDNGTQAWLETWQSDDGVAWTSYTVGGTIASQPIYNSTAPVEIGSIGTGVLAFNGRIYSVELRTGLSPTGGTVLWKFDANDVPVGATTYTDPRGRQWTLTNPAAVKNPDVPIWRFDADEYPGTGTSYVDPRGRTWTLSAANAITPYTPAREAEVLWRFDADEYPGGRVTSYVDPRGRTWTLTNPDAVRTKGPIWRFDAEEYPGAGMSYTDPRGRVWTLTTAGAIDLAP